jgi:hypothetical protein
MSLVCVPASRVRAQRYRPRGVDWVRVVFSPFFWFLVLCARLRDQTVGLPWHGSAAAAGTRKWLSATVLALLPGGRVGKVIHAHCR